MVYVLIITPAFLGNLFLLSDVKTAMSSGFMLDHFMNSALQCLSNTFDLTSYFLTREFEKDVNKENPLGAGGRLAYAYAELMKDMWLGHSSYVSPWDLKKTIGKLASQFVGYGQQDSQELLSYLLDGLHEDLNRIKKKATH